MTDTDLSLLLDQNRRMLTELLSLRDDVAVLTAITTRLDGSHSALLSEIRATHSQISRMNNRLRTLEGSDA